MSFNILFDDACVPICMSQYALMRFPNHKIKKKYDLEIDLCIQLTDKPYTVSVYYDDGYIVEVYERYTYIPVEQDPIHTIYQDNLSSHDKDMRLLFQGACFLHKYMNANRTYQMYYDGINCHSIYIKRKGNSYKFHKSTLEDEQFPCIDENGNIIDMYDFDREFIPKKKTYHDVFDEIVTIQFDGPIDFGDPYVNYYYYHDRDESVIAYGYRLLEEHDERGYFVCALAYVLGTDFPTNWLYALDYLLVCDFEEADVYLLYDILIGLINHQQKKGKMYLYHLTSLYEYLFCRNLRFKCNDYMKHAKMLLKDNPFFYQEIAHVYRLARNDSACIEYLKQGIRAHQTRCHYLLGLVYLDIEHYNPKKALHHIGAVSGSISEANYTLGMMYYQGEDIKKNKTKAIKCFKRYLETTYDPEIVALLSHLEN